MNFDLDYTDYPSRTVESNSLRSFLEFPHIRLFCIQINKNKFTYDKFKAAKFGFSTFPCWTQNITGEWEGTEYFLAKFPSKLIITGTTIRGNTVYVYSFSCLLKPADLASPYTQVSTPNQFLVNQHLDLETSELGWSWPAFRFS